MNAQHIQTDRRRLAEAMRRGILDRVTESLLAGFSKENDIEELEESQRFEHFAAFS